jgi:hypothetical protein
MEAPRGAPGEYGESAKVLAIPAVALVVIMNSAGAIDLGEVAPFVATVPQ